MKNFEQIGTEIGELVEVKNAAYGSSFAKSAQFLRLLYPDGLQPEQYADALLIVRVFDKLMRIATHRDALGENPWADITGYGILGFHLHQKTESEEQCQGSACGPDAATSSSEKANGAAASAAASTQPPSAVPHAQEPSPQPDGNSAELQYAAAPTAAAAASREEDAELRMLVDILGRRATEIYESSGNGGTDRSDAKDLIRVLARMLAGQSLRVAFGAPGDWGYQTAMGKALAALYGSDSLSRMKVTR